MASERQRSNLSVGEAEATIDTLQWWARGKQFQFSCYDDGLKHFSSSHRPEDKVVTVGLTPW